MVERPAELCAGLRSAELTAEARPRTSATGGLKAARFRRPSIDGVARSGDRATTGKRTTTARRGKADLENFFVHQCVWERGCNARVSGAGNAEVFGVGLQLDCYSANASSSVAESWMVVASFRSFSTVYRS